ncbi:hypothetical protein XHV734_0832 [Xanthomonas hortorum pv. vitians]|nr:hypothetical protein XHV734_0832 [Xanthomonas hortorum pv. vitians]
MAWRREQLLGPQRHHPHPGLRRSRRPAGAARAQAVRRACAQPRFCRSGADAAGRLGHAHGAVPAGQLRRRPAHADRPADPRPSLVPGQPAACQGRRRQGAALDQPHAHDDRHRALLHRADVGHVDADRHRHSAGRGRHRPGPGPAVLACALLARQQRRQRDLDFRLHHVRAAGAQAAGLYRTAAQPARTACLRRGVSRHAEHPAGNRVGGPDGAGGDVSAVARRVRSAGRQGFGLGCAGARRRQAGVAGAAAQLRRADHLRPVHGLDGLRGLAVAGGLDGAGDYRYGLVHSGGGTDLVAPHRPGSAAGRHLLHSRRTRPAQGAGACGRTAPRRRAGALADLSAARCARPAAHAGRAWQAAQGTPGPIATRGLPAA